VKTRTILIALAAALLALNIADLATTWFMISNGKGVEANPIVLFLGGPFSPLEIFLKVVVFPTTILAIAWWLAHKAKNAKLAVAAMIPPVIVMGAVVANNVIVAAKKVAKKVEKISNER
jgi:hypothetical protein